MLSLVESKKARLEQERLDNPLEKKWLKMDFVEATEAVLIYYSVNPEFTVTGEDVRLIKMIDCEEIFDVLIASEFFMYTRGSLKLREFIGWLVEKGYPIPLHLQMHEKSAESDNEGSDEGGDLPKPASVKLPTLCGELAARLMKELSKEPKYMSLPAKEIIQKSEEFKSLRIIFKILRKGKDFEDEWYQRKTSSVGPFSRK